jgi:antitoxin CptB
MADQTAASGTTPPADEARRKRILYRCQHRGMKEMDILLGGYVGTHVANLSPDELNVLERLLDVSDQDLFNWMIGRAPVPAEHDTPLYRAIAAYKSSG